MLQSDDFLCVAIFCNVIENHLAARRPSLRPRTSTCVPKGCCLGLGVWDSGFNAWLIGFGTGGAVLGLGLGLAWNLGIRLWTLVVFGKCLYYVGFDGLDPGLGILDCGIHGWYIIVFVWEFPRSVVRAVDAMKWNLLFSIALSYFVCVLACRLGRPCVDTFWLSLDVVMNCFAQSREGHGYDEIHVLDLHLLFEMSFSHLQGLARMSGRWRQALRIAAGRGLLRCFFMTCEWQHHNSSALWPQGLVDLRCKSGVMCLCVRRWVLVCMRACRYACMHACKACMCLCPSVCRFGGSVRVVRGSMYGCMCAWMH